jgi:hypothetical protein
MNEYAKRKLKKHGDKVDFIPGAKFYPLIMNVFGGYNDYTKKYISEIASHCSGAAQFDGVENFRSSHVNSMIVALHRGNNIAKRSTIQSIITSRAWGAPSSTTWQGQGEWPGAAPCA